MKPILSFDNSAINQIVKDSFPDSILSAIAVAYVLHTNIPGSARAKRWEDVEFLQDAGIEVWTTANRHFLLFVYRWCVSLGVPKLEQLEPFAKTA
jgi:hypothetical protein